jgi:hypothetical protein
LNNRQTGKNWQNCGRARSVKHKIKLCEDGISF